MMPVVLVTGQGMPDIATRAMVCQITHAHAPSSYQGLKGAVPGGGDMCVMAMVDWNPSGCYIACNYKFGNKRATKQSTTCSLASIIRNSMIRSLALDRS
jgi:DNA topoisomerase VI subunit A